MAIVRVHAIVCGRVQGVFFRDFTVQQAESLGLTGWVRNCSNGTVESEIQGEESEVSRMIHWFHEGSPLSQVTGVKTNPAMVCLAERTFVVKY